MFTVDTLHKLPDSLTPGNIATKVIDNHMFFFSCESPLSNFFTPAKFTVKGVEYVNSEQYILKNKAILSKAPNVAEDIIQESDPRRMKQLTRNLPQFNHQEWKKHSEDIGCIAVLNKFQQNPDLHKYLMDTEGKVLVEV